MRVKRTNEHKEVDFAILEPGDCFIWKGNLFIKVDYEQEAVCLDDGYAVAEMGGETVTPINAEVHIID